MPSIFIGSFTEGLEKGTEPYLLPNDAFTDLEDAYVFRGSVKRKEGYRLLGRLQRSATAGALPNAGATTATGTITPAVISPGSLIMSVATVPPLVFNDNGDGTLSSSTVDVNFGVIDYETGVYTLNFDPAIAAGAAVTVTSYSTLSRKPVMGLSAYELPVINQESLLAFDTEKSYLFDTGLSQFTMLSTGTWGASNQFNSSNSDFVWTTNYYTQGGKKLLWATNNIEYNVTGQDGIQFYNGTSWTTIAPKVSSSEYLRGTLLLIPYRNRMVALNTLEGIAPANPVVRYPSRARWSQNGVPFPDKDAIGGAITGGNPDAWRSDIVGKGGFIDAPTSQSIVSAGFVKDTLIVFFERSTWELRYTGNALLPFIWQRINTELGAESTFSAISFDEGILAVGDKRIISANPGGITPIDAKIPDEVFGFHNDNTGPKRVHGIRDFFKKLAVWTFPNDVTNGIFPNRMLAYNYDNNSFAIFNDSFTALGTYQQVSDYTWGNPPAPTWGEAKGTWGSVSNQSFFPSIVAGNQASFVEVLLTTTANEVSLDLVGPGSITKTAPATFNVVNHNLSVGAFITLNNTRAFPITVAGELLGEALTGATSYNCALANRGVIPGTAVVTLGATVFTDVGSGVLKSVGATGVINYSNVDISLSFPGLVVNTAVSVDYDYNILNTRPFELVSSTADTFTLKPYGKDIATESLGTALSGSTRYVANLSHGDIVAGTVKVIIGSITYQDNSDGTLSGGDSTSIIDYTSGAIELGYSALAVNTVGTVSYTALSNVEDNIGFAAAASNYDGTGEITIIPSFKIRSKRFSPFLESTSNFRIKYIDFLLKRSTGSFEIDSLVDQSKSLVNDTFKASTAAEGDDNINAEKLWKRVYINTVSNFIQIEFRRSKFMMSNPIDYNTDWKMSAMIIEVDGAGRLK